MPEFNKYDIKICDFLIRLFYRHNTEYINKGNLALILIYKHAYKITVSTVFIDNKICYIFGLFDKLHKNSDV